MASDAFFNFGEIANISIWSLFSRLYYVNKRNSKFTPKHVSSVSTPADTGCNRRPSRAYQSVGLKFKVPLVHQTH
ncbi:uncharacterized protein BO80DRAFT_425060 [Aspergillus ibericus CBS 121593]|uniref:Uncharacterized protein n=1 Tax=Aspergillus ibericus CBS 121593 TaxID=1448316 RepID=A0A395H0E2_9EURO|nr:hypothetical protein BO80DRAFT_425060 [Aspergillus ibericus CBS 121593]RAL01080.1 hypothetical protein BO80DRAFT_425060 [Aspergillus ibericus CBS 121593]